MPKVKGSKQEQMMVVPFRPPTYFGGRLALICGFFLFSFGAYCVGHYFGWKENPGVIVESGRFKNIINPFDNDINQLRQKLVAQEQLSLLDKQALDNVQITLLSLREKISKLEEEVLFYKEIMSPENNETGLVIGQLELLTTNVDNSFRYKLEIKQQGNNENLITGFANVSIMGVLDGDSKTFPLKDLTNTEKSIDIRLQFRYFQNLEGILVLPEGFEPEKVQINAVNEGKVVKTLQKSFVWVVED